MKSDAQIDAVDFYIQATEKDSYDEMFLFGLKTGMRAMLVFFEELSNAKTWLVLLRTAQYDHLDDDLLSKLETYIARREVETNE